MAEQLNPHGKHNNNCARAHVVALRSALHLGVALLGSWGLVEEILFLKFQKVLRAALHVEEERVGLADILDVYARGLAAAGYEGGRRDELDGIPMEMQAV